MSLFKSVRIALFLGAAAALAYGAWAAFDQAAFLRAAVSAEGTVVRLDWHVDLRPGGASGYRIVVRFRRADGRAGELVDEAGPGPAPYSVGERVRVLYDPADPAIAKMGGFRSLWLAPVSALLAGALLLAVLAATRLGGALSGPRRWSFRLRLPRPWPKSGAAAPGRLASRIAYCIPAWCWPFLLLYIAQGDWGKGGLDSKLSLAVFFLCNAPAVYGWLRGRLPWLEMAMLALVAPFLVWAALVLRA